MRSSLGTQRTQTGGGGRAGKALEEGWCEEVRRYLVSCREGHGGAEGFLLQHPGGFPVGGGRELATSTALTTRPGCPGFSFVLQGPTTILNTPHLSPLCLCPPPQLKRPISHLDDCHHPLACLLVPGLYPRSTYQVCPSLC